MASKQSRRQSHGWLAVFSFVQVVLTGLFGVGLGLTLTLGTPAKVATQLTSGTSRTALAQSFNTQVLAAAQAGGLTLSSGAKVATPAITSKFTKQLVEASADFQKTIDVTTTQQALHQQLRLAAKPAHTQPTAAQWQLIERKVDAAVAKAANDMLQTGIGAAYGITVLTLQTMTIVCGILSVINIAFMALSAHSLRRFLKTFGRLLYLVGFLAGAVTLIAAVPALSADMRFGGAPVGVVAQLVQAFAPLWQHVAGIVIVIGLVLAGGSYLIPRKIK